MNKKTYFLHIPKTAGSTLRAVFKRNHEGSFELIPGNDPVGGLARAKEKSNWAEKELIWLHGDWGSCDEGANNLTMLREPMARMESFYFYVKSQPDHYLHSFSKGTDAVGFFEKAETLETKNGQCRIVAGFGGYHGMHASNNTDLDNVQLFDLARTNLFEKALAFGLQDRFVDSLMIFEEKLKWEKGIKFRTVNKRANDYKRSSLSKRELECIAELNAEDIRLYKEAKEVFHDRFEKSKNTMRILKYKILRR